MKNIYFIVFLVFDALLSFFEGQLPHPGNYIWVFSTFCIILALVIWFSEGIHTQSIVATAAADAAQAKQQAQATVNKVDQAIANIDNKVTTAVTTAVSNIKASV